MHGEETSSTPVVQVAGRALTAEVAAKLTSAAVDDSLGVPDMLLLGFLDDAEVLEKAGVEIGAQVTLAVQQSGTGAPTPLFVGEVTAVEVELSAGGTRTVVRGYDLSHRLYRGRRVKSFVNQKPADIVRAKAGDAGIQMGSVDAAGGVLEHVAQAGVSDWALLQRLAVRTGAVLAVKEGKLDFRKATPATSGPGGANARQDPLVLEKGVNLVSLRACVSAADQVPSVEVRSWDVKQKKAIVGTANAGTTSATLDGGLDPGRLAKAVKAPPLVEPRTTQPDQQGCATHGRGDRGPDRRHSCGARGRRPRQPQAARRCGREARRRREDLRRPVHAHVDAPRVRFGPRLPDRIHREQCLRPDGLRPGDRRRLGRADRSHARGRRRRRERRQGQGQARPGPASRSRRSATTS